MFYWAVVFLVVGLIAAVFGFTGLAGTAVNIAWILFVVGLILFVVFMVLGRRRPPLYGGPPHHLAPAGSWILPARLVSTVAPWLHRRFNGVIRARLPASPGRPA
jgi:uncharacterized membrane protein YtjA (UPF0391 family)